VALEMEPAQSAGAADGNAIFSAGLSSLLERDGIDYRSSEHFWEALQQNIRERLGQERYSLWFQQTELMGAREGCLVVGVPNVIIQQFLTARYTEAVSAAAEELIGRPMAVSFDVAPRLFRRMRALRKAERDEADRADPGVRPATGQVETIKPPPGWGFEHLIVTRSNRLSIAAAKELAGQENPRFSFLYVCGDYGLGKTAMLHAIYAMAADMHGLKPVYTSAESWGNQYFFAVQQKRTRAFRSRYRSSDMLLIDDVQFVAGKPGAQRELVHTVKEVLARGGRVVLSGKPLPDELTGVDDAFRALLRKAFPAVLVRPGEDELVRVVGELAVRRGVDVTQDVCRFMARAHGRCLASMEAAVARLALLAGVEGLRKVTLVEALRAFPSIESRGEPRPVGLAEVRDAVLEAFPVEAQELAGRSRRRSVCRARHVGMYLSQRLTAASLSEIAHFYGRSSHSTVKHGVDKIAREAEHNAALAALVGRLERELLHGGTAAPG